MKKTIFTTPGISSLFRVFSIVTLKLMGWKVIGTAPEKHRFVMIAAPHTSNWDFPLMLMAVFVLRMEVHWMGKESLFPWYVRGLAKWLGGIPINRSQTNNAVDQNIEHYRLNDNLIVLMTPEGTRGKVSHWKSGFYHIANGAGVPVVFASVDSSRKQMEISGYFHTTGDLDADLIEIKKFYADKTGINADLG